MTKIKLMADYGCYPLWWVDVGKAGPVEPELPLSEETDTRLQKWADSYDDRLDWDDPGNSPPPTPEESAAFEQEGISLWGQLQKELAPNYEVVYFSQALGRVVTDVSELEEVSND
jgi:hypothetical protein